MEQGEWLYRVAKADFIDTLTDLPGWAFWLGMFSLMLGFWALLWWTKRRSPNGRGRQMSPGPFGRGERASPSLRCSLCGGPLQYGAITIAGQRYLARHCPKCDGEPEEAKP